MSKDSESTTFADIANIANIGNISIGNNVKENTTSIMAEIDKHIEIRFLKEGRRNKTYLYGFCDYVEEKNLKKIIEKIQKNLGTSVKEEEKDGKKFYAFGGDHVSTLKKIMLNEFKIPQDKIKA